MDPEHTSRLLETVKASPPAALHAAYSAVVQGDYDLFKELVTDDVELHVSGFGAMDGSWRGRDAVVAATRNNFSLVAHQKPVIESLVSQGDCVAVMMRESGVLKADNRSYSIRCVQWFTFEGERLKRIEEIVSQLPG